MPVRTEHPKLRLIEHYYSTQGEGPRVGVKTQFVRFAGCDLECALWPCDTQYAIRPEIFESRQELVDPIRLFADVEQMAMVTGARNICLTGGEPMIQNAFALDVFIRMFTGLPEYTLEMFSNGTIKYTDAVLDHVALVMDWKLPGSGEYGKLGDTVLANVSRMKFFPGNSVKFTVADERDLFVAKDLYDQHLSNYRKYLEIFVSPVWGKIEPEVIVDFIRIQRLPWRLTLQVHKYIWSPTAEGV